MIQNISVLIEVETENYEAVLEKLSIIAHSEGVTKCDAEVSFTALNVGKYKSNKQFNARIAEVLNAACEISTIL